MSGPEVGTPSAHTISGTLRYQRLDTLQQELTKFIPNGHWTQKKHGYSGSGSAEDSNWGWVAIPNTVVKLYYYK